jgi:Spy/CpxP family protein refolding chaperone
MQRQFWALAALAALAAAPATASAQARDSMPMRREMMGGRPGGRFGSPADMLLAQREELKLSADQVKRLEAIRTKYDAKDRPLLEKMRQWRNEHRDDRTESRADSGAAPERRRGDRAEMRRQREAYLDQHPELRDVVKQLRADRGAMRKESFAVLTSAQRDQVRQQMERRRGEWEKRKEGGEREGGR